MSCFLKGFSFDAFFRCVNPALQEHFLAAFVSPVASNYFLIYLQWVIVDGSQSSTDRVRQTPCIRNSLKYFYSVLAETR